ncbi:hypothetical protein COO60DRAFT_568402 [Scenedesmus sp. NREL 46B-D3]|nr:hypothetical protein COO60DRAFT_568402 [Scenedesmus sp. NREL 46B-D3]
MAEPHSKRARLDSDASLEQHGLAVMLTDIEEEGNGVLLLWGLSMNDQQRTVLLVVPDYKPSFYLPCPLKADTAQKTFSQAHPEDIRQLHRHLNARLPSESQLESVEVQQQRPIMYYRPEQPEGIPFLKCTLKPGSSVKKAAGAVEKVVADGSLAGFSWRQRGTNPHEADVKPLTRFLCDASLSGGSWLWACSTPTTQQQQQQQQQQQAATAAAADRSSSQALFQVVPAGSSRRRSSCAVEVVCSWRCLHSLTPDATQLAEPDWQPPCCSSWTLCRQPCARRLQQQQRATSCRCASWCWMCWPHRLMAAAAPAMPRRTQPLL